MFIYLVSRRTRVCRLADLREVPFRSESQPVKRQGEQTRQTKRRGVEATLYRPEAHWSKWCKATAESSHIDRFCSSGFWGLPLIRAFYPETRLWVFDSPEDSNLALFAEHEGLLLPADCMWNLGCPLLGADPVALGETLLEVFLNPRTKLPRTVVITGLLDGHPLLENPFWTRLKHRELPGSGRHIASLEGGLDGFLSRRSKNFRSRLKRTVKKSQAQGIEVEPFPHSPNKDQLKLLWQRVLEIEKMSWKGLGGRGIDSGPMKGFYRRMLPLLAGEGYLRGLFLTREGQDLAYLLGGCFMGTFRGLQFSFKHQSFDGLGNVAQYSMIARLAEEACQTYDLGQAMAYKARWADTESVSRSCVFKV